MAGLPISQQTQQTYQAPPNTMSQVAGIGTTLLGGYLTGKAAGFFKAGGQITEGSDLADLQLHRLVG